MTQTDGNRTDPVETVRPEGDRAGGMQLNTKIKLGLAGLMLLFALNVASTLMRSRSVLANTSRATAARQEAAANDAIYQDGFVLRRLVQSYSYSGDESTAERIRQISLELAKKIDGSLRFSSTSDIRYHLETMQVHLDGYQQRFKEVVAERKLRQELLEHITTTGSDTRNQLQELVRQKTSETEDVEQGPQECLRHLALAEIQILRYLSDPSTLIAKGAVAELQTAIEAAQESSLETTVNNLKSLRSDFLRITQATRGYLYLVNVVMAGEASEFAYHSAQIDALSQRQLAAISAETTQRSQRAGWFAIMLGSLAALGALFLGATLLRGIIEPITQITETLSRLARGERVGTIPGLKRRDEIGEMSRAAYVFSQKNEETEHLLHQAQQLSAELDQQARTLAKSNRELDAFAHVASHDLKSPLRGIDNLVNFLTEDLGDDLPSDSREHVRLLREKVRLMENLLNDLLSYSRAGRVQQDVELIDTKELVEEIRRTIDWPEGMQLVTVDPMPTFATDRTALRQVLQNLMTNAVKYRGEESPRLEIAARDLGRQVKFRVSDNGPGIEPIYHEKIFQMFQRLRTKEGIEGSGMGLPIIQKLVQYYGGTITVDSDVGRGATFSFTWPNGNQQSPRPKVESDETVAIAGSV